MADTIRKTLTAETSAAKGTFTATISTDSIDRDGEVLVPQGMNSTEFDRNPVVFWNHNYDMPVGRAVSMSRTDRSVVATASFARRPDDFVGEFFPDFARALVEQGVVKGVSVGFQPLPDGVRKATAADRERYGEGVERVFSKWKLLEFSLAPLPANQDALVSAVGKSCRSCGIAESKAMEWLGIEPPRKARRGTVVVVQDFPQPKRGPDVEAMAADAVSKAIARRRGRLFA